MRGAAAALATLTTLTICVSADRSTFRAHPGVQEEKAGANQFWPFPLPDIDLPGLNPPTDPPTHSPTGAPTPKPGFFPILPNIPNFPWLPGGGGGEANNPKPAPVPAPVPAPEPAPAPKPAPIPPPEDLPGSYMCVQARYVPWGKYPADGQMVLEEDLGYNEGTWNREGTNPREKISWKNLEDNEQQTWGWLGYVAKSYDCFINHYDEYSWDELQEIGLDLHLEMLGADQESWDAYDAPEAFRYDWDELTVDEKDAARRLCYVEDNWNANNLEDYTWNC